MIESILDSVKVNSGIEVDYNEFDHDIITYINAAFSTLTQLGVGPSEGFMIEDKTTTWNEFTEDMPQLNAVKSYVYIRVRLLFDPPTSGYGLTSMKEQRLELEWRLNLTREEKLWPAQQLRL